MLFSGKITNSFLNFLDRAGFDPEKLLELTELPTEFLRDPSCWIEAHDVESFLLSVEKQFGSNFSEGLPTLVGHQCHELRAWGVLDSVIRMMSQPQDLFLQPHRFISYFVSPAPPLARIVREQDSISFDIPISNQEFPQTTEFLRSAMETLPKYLGRELAQARWIQNRLSVSWREAQVPFLTDKDLTPNFKPELVQNLMHALEESQRQIEELNRKMGEQKSQSANAEIDPEYQQNLRSHVVKVRGHLLRLTDYLVRSQQLVTLLVGQNRMDRQVQEAMRRVDWDYVRAQSSQVAQDTVDLLSEFETEIESKIKPREARSSKVALQRTLDLPS